MGNPNNQFLLPDELGWDCNDEISELMIDKLAKLAEHVLKAGSTIAKRRMIKAGVAEIMDEVYAIIKKYQNAKSEATAVPTTTYACSVCQAKYITTSKGLKSLACISSDCDGVMYSPNKETSDE